MVVVSQGNKVDKMWIDCFAALLFMQLMIGPSVAEQSELEKCGNKTASDALYPRCTLSMENNNGVKQQCLDGGEVLRIIGDYRVFRIKCMSLFRLEFTYDGTVTPHAITVRRITYFDANDVTKEHGTTVRIRSVSYLEENLRWTGLGKRPLVTQNSRTGKFNLFATGHPREFSKSYYIFFEEPGQEHKLIKSKHTDHVNYKLDNVCASVPCRSTHYESMPTLEVSQSNLYVKQGKTNGFDICGLNKTENFYCHLKDNGSKDNLEFRDNKDTNGGGPRYEYFQPKSARGQSKSYHKILAHRLLQA